MAKTAEKPKRSRAGRLNVQRLILYVAVTAVLFACVIWFLRSNGIRRIAPDAERTAVRTAAAVRDTEEVAEKIVQRGLEIPQDAIRPTIEDENYIVRDQVEQCFLNLDTLTDGSSIQTLGGYSIPQELLGQLNGMITNLRRRGSPMGFVMIDVASGKGIAYNPKEEFYSASSVKGPYMVSTIAQHPEALDEYTELFETIGLVSDNGCYNSLFSVYGSEPFNNWCDEAGADGQMYTGWNYTYYSAESLLRLWLLNYQFFTTGGSYGERAGQLFEQPNYSAIKESLGQYYHTRSKSGWININPISAVDSGVIYADSPYICTVLAQYGGSLDELDKYFFLLDRIHADITGTESKIPDGIEFMDSKDRKKMLTEIYKAMQQDQEAFLSRREMEQEALENADRMTQQDREALQSEQTAQQDQQAAQQEQEALQSRQVTPSPTPTETPTPVPTETPAPAATQQGDTARAAG